MDKQEAKVIVNNWNGKDKKFITHGSVYTETDVQLAEKLLENDS